MSDFSGKKQRTRREEWPDHTVHPLLGQTVFTEGLANKRRTVTRGTLKCYLNSGPRKEIRGGEHLSNCSFPDARDFAFLRVHP